MGARARLAGLVLAVACVGSARSAGAHFDLRETLTKLTQYDHEHPGFLEGVALLCLVTLVLLCVTLWFVLSVWATHRERRRHTERPAREAQTQTEHSSFSAKEQGLLRLKKKRDLLEKSKKFMEEKRDQELAKVKELLKKKTRTDKDNEEKLKHLKKKNMYDEQADKVESYILKKDAQIMEIEQELLQERVQAALTAPDGGGAGCQDQGGPGIAQEEEKRDALKEQSERDLRLLALKATELLQESGEVQAALTAPIAGQDLDEDDLLAELEGLDQEATNESLGEVPLQAAETDEKRQLRQLKASME